MSDDDGGVAVTKTKLNKSSSSFQTTRIQVVEPVESPRWASGKPLETRGESRGVECVHVCVMMVEHQPQECSPVKNMMRDAADKPLSNGSSQPGASGDDDSAASADKGAAMTATAPTAASVTATSSADITQASRTYPTPPVPKEALLYAPLLVGKYYIEDKRAVWSGKWGMTEAAFGENGITSPFEMRSQEDVYIPTATADSAEAVNPSFFGVALARSSRLENDSPSQVSPMYLGYETNPDVRSAMPFRSKYSGFFQIQAVKGKPQTVTEKDVDIRFVHDASNPSFFAVTGSGENRFGVFALHGFLDKTTNELRIYKIYKPKQPEKRALPRRTRNTKAVTPPAAPKPPVAAAVALPPVPVPAPAPAVSSVRPTIAQTPVPAASTHPVAAPRSVGTPMSDYSSPSVGGRARSERKRIIPAHLRDENVIELDRVPANLKKCHAILKSLMSSSKATPFLVPVDPVALGIPDYFQVIKEPMDLGTIKQNLECGYYDDTSVFADHVRLVFRNAMLYNAAHSQVHIYAQKLLEDFQKRIKSLNLKTPAKEKTIQTKHAAIKVKKERKAESSHHSSKKIKGGKGSKGNTKRRAASDEAGLIMSLKEDIERLKATLEQLQPSIKVSTPKPSKAAARYVVWCDAGLVLITPVSLTGLFDCYHVQAFQDERSNGGRTERTDDATREGAAEHRHQVASSGQDQSRAADHCGGRAGRQACERERRNRVRHQRVRHALPAHAGRICQGTSASLSRLLSALDSLTRFCPLLVHIGERYRTEAEATGSQEVASGSSREPT